MRTTYFSRRQPQQGVVNVRSLRRFLLCILFFLACIVGHLQLIVSPSLSGHALQQQVRRTVQPGPRGIITARDGEILNETVPVHQLAVYVEQIRDPRDTRARTLDKVQTVIARLARVLGRRHFYRVPSREEILNHVVRRAPLPFLLWDAADAEMLAKWAVHREEFPGVDVVTTYRRRYQFPQTAYHLRGITGRADPIGPYEAVDFSGKDLVGRSGMELACDYRLRGVPGHETVTVDVFSFRHDVLEAAPPRPGEVICLALDLPVQQQAEALFRQDALSGGLVAMDVVTGEILVLVSEPSPGLEVNSVAYRSVLADSEAAAFLNRSLRAAYPPGSILKPLIAIAGLESGAITPHDRVVCNGAFFLTAQRSVHCWRRDGHGPVSLFDALGQSCNVYFCALAERIGPQRVGEWAQRVGLGERPFSLLEQDESAGILFSPEWKRAHDLDSGRWHAGDTANLAIGQGAWLVTPLQACLYASCLATGQRIRPELLRSNTPATVVAACGWSESTRAAVHEGMRQAVEQPGGTARMTAIPGVGVCAKTGTAQTVRSGLRTTCGWTIAFAPAERPRFAVACAVEDAASGGGVAAPIVREVLRSLLVRHGQEDLAGTDAEGGYAPPGPGAGRHRPGGGT